jgi:hypothetical protein
MAVPTSSKVAVGTSPTPLFTPQAFASRVTIQNLSGADMYIGGSTVSATTGFKLSNGSTLVMEAGSSGPVFGIAAVAQTSPADTRILIEPTN